MTGALYAILDAGAVCQGRIFYALAEQRTGEDRDVALLRLERCYPFPGDELVRELDRFGGAQIVWAQEEPENMGAARFVVRNLRDHLGVEIRVIARSESASPATGSFSLHRQEQAGLVDRALVRDRTSPELSRTVRRPGLERTEPPRELSQSRWPVPVS